MAIADARIELEIESPIGWLVLDNRARRNAVTLDMWRKIPEAIAALNENDAVRVIILRGAGEETFVSGADISEFSTARRDARNAQDYENTNLIAFDAIRASAKPTIAMIRGFCIGGGMGIAAACDLRFAAEGSRFAIPAAHLGLGYPPAAVRDIVALVGKARAKDLFFSARRAEADEALAIGLIDRLVGDADLERHTRAYAGNIAENAPLTIAAAKAAIEALTGDPATADWEAVETSAARCFDSADFTEGRTAFLEKRTPQFTGK